MRVLCYSPYNLWTLHGLWEMTILHALRLRGAEVRYVLCDGLYAECDVFWASTNPRDDLACVRCQAHVARLAQELCMAYEWLGRYLLPEELGRARAWARQCPAQDYATACYGAWPVGEWVRSSVHSHFRTSQLDLTDATLCSTYRAYIEAGLIACFALERLLDHFQPDLLFLFNGRMATPRVALELARRRGIRVVCHERGLTRESLCMFENCNALALEPIRALWDDWGHVPLNACEQKRIDMHMLDRAHGRNVGDREFSPPQQASDDTRAALGLSGDRPLWLLFTSSEDEVIAHRELVGPFARQIDWIRDTIDYVRVHPEIELVIRVHPNTGSGRSIGKNIGQLREIDALRSDLPGNARIVGADDPLSSYTLMELASVGLVYMSTTGLELACRGVPVVVAAYASIHDLPFATTVRSRERYTEDLDRLRAAPPGEHAAAVARLAHRFAYAMFFRWSIPFPLVHMPDAHNGRLRYNTLDALLPGRDPHLDRICRILLEGEAVCCGPSPEHQAASEVDELHWLEANWSTRALCTRDVLAPDG